MNTKFMLLDVDCFESSIGNHWVVKQWYSNGFFKAVSFNWEKDYLDFINPLLQDDVVLVFHRYNIEEYNKLFNLALEFEIDL